MAVTTIPTRYRLRVKQRLAVVEYTREHGIKPASRHFGLARHTVRRWWRDWPRRSRRTGAEVRETAAATNCR